MDDTTSKRQTLWIRALESLVQGRTEVSEDIMDELIENVRSVVEKEDEKEIDEFLDKLDENYKESAKKIDESTDERRPNDTRKRRMNYRRLEQWRIGELYRFLSDLLRRKDLIGGEEIEPETE